MDKKGIGYHHNGKSYEYPIKNKEHLDIVKKSGGQIKSKALTKKAGKVDKKLDNYRKGKGG